MDVRGWSDIAYSFLINHEGTVYQGRGPGVAGGHTAGQNTVSHAICLLGNFDQTQPTTAALDATVELARHGYESGWWPETFTGGHRDAPLADTSCPGKHLYSKLPEINTLLEADMPLTQEDKEFITAAVRGDNTEQTESVWNRYVIRNSAGGFVSLVKALQFIYRKLENQSVPVDEAAIAQAVVAEMSPALRAAVAAELAKLTMKAV